MGILLEVCVETLEDACVAAEGGAGRLELCGVLSVGGVTPSLGLVEAALEEAGVPCVALVRPRGGDFLYTARERRVMLRDVERFGELGCAGVVVGALSAEAHLDVGFLRELVGAAGPQEVCLHRAFDATADLERALEAAIELRFRRILSSGGASTAPHGAKRIGALVALARERIEILPGGGVRANNARELVRTSGVKQLHSSCGAMRAGKMRQRPAHLVLGSSETGAAENWRVDPVELRALLGVLAELP